MGKLTQYEECWTSATPKLSLMLISLTLMLIGCVKFYNLGWVSHY